MAQNDNLTPQVQKAIVKNEAAFNVTLQESRAWWLDKLRTHYHPNIKGLPDYGISSLQPETEAYCRDLCERNGFSYEEFKDQFDARTQVIQRRMSNPISLKLMEKGVCPLNDLDAGFKAYVQGGVSIKRQLRNERALRVQQELADVK